MTAPGGTQSPEDRLAALGLTLPEVVPPVAAYQPAVRTGSYVYTAGQLPVSGGQLLAKGKVGAEVTAEEASALARTCALNALAAVVSVAGSLSAIRRIVKVTGFVASAPDFTGQPQVMNGASELLVEIFGDAGRHARSAVGTAVLPLDAPVEVELIAEVAGEVGQVGRDASGPAAIRFRGTLSDRAREIIEGSEPPAVPRDAATVMLLRQRGGAPSDPGRPAAPGGPGGPGGLEVYMLRRQPTMAFAPGAFVFPGGSVDARDADEQVAWTGPDAAAWAESLAAPPELARALVCAAVRETFEESGVLLAGPSPEAVVADTTSHDWEADRLALLDRSLSLAGLLRRRRLVLRADLLRPWSRWITPAVEPRRFDARFFAAALPPGQRTRDVGGEAAAVTWIAPGAAIEAGRRDEIALWPPTAVSLAELAACGDLVTALDGPRELVPRIPEVLIREGAVWLTVPGVQEYPL